MAFIFQPIRDELRSAAKRHSHYVRGKVLDVGAGSFDRYSNLFPYGSYTRMDIPGTKNIDLEGIAEKIPAADASYDSVVCTQALSDVWDVRKAFAEFHRVLCKNGILLLTSGFLDPLNEDFGEYWRFTPNAYRRLATEAGFHVEVLEPIGGYWSVKAQFAIRHQIALWDAYNRSWCRLFSFICRLYGRHMIWRDSLQPISEKRSITHGHILIARKR